MDNLEKNDSTKELEQKQSSEEPVQTKSDAVDMQSIEETDADTSVDNASSEAVQDLSEKTDEVQVTADDLDDLEEVQTVSDTEEEVQATTNDIEEPQAAVDVAEKDQETVDTSEQEKVDTSEKVEGEAYISLERAKERSLDYNVSYEEEIIRLVTHGLLHLAGRTHNSDKEYQSMMEDTEKFVNNFFHNGELN